MPQLDKLSFIPQLLWFFSVFFLTLVIFSQSILPRLAITLKLRSRILENLIASKDSNTQSLDSLNDLKVIEIETFLKEMDKKVNLLDISLKRQKVVSIILFLSSKKLAKIKKIYKKESFLSLLVSLGSQDFYKEEYEVDIYI